VPFDVNAARSLAAGVFPPAGDRWAHARATARQAEHVASVVGPSDRETLVCAAWLHDVGMAAGAARTGFRPLDGALLLRAAGWPDPVVALVAHQCEARITAEVLGLGPELDAFARPAGPVSDALVFADLAAGPDGHRTSLRDRLAALDTRYRDEGEAMVEAWVRRRPELVAAAARTEQRLAGARRGRGRDDTFATS